MQDQEDKRRAFIALSDRSADAMARYFAEIESSRASPLRVELYKGLGLARYFRKRAQGLGQRVAAWLIGPLVVGAAVARPILWRITGRAI